MCRIVYILFFLQIFYSIKQIDGHGYLADPPARSSAWMFDKEFSKCCRYYNHAEMSCGGAYHEWIVNRGKCSICGEAADLKPTLLGMGDEMYLGKIVRTYTQGSTIQVTVVLTANHKGSFEFRVCSVDDDPTKDATHNCLDLNLLNVTNDIRVPHKKIEPTQYQVSDTATTVHINVTLPQNLVCKHCVFQWKYITGNSWGESNGVACMGCGKKNEEFYGCSDIAIVGDVESIVDSPTTTTPTTTTTTTTTTPKPTTAPAARRKCRSAITFSQVFDISGIMDEYCQLVCPNNCASDVTLGNNMLYEGCVATCKKLCICE
ncbi:unnamed protein product [Adineta steineri]|uniref:Chitin-binding type-4 domain-containing protein n=1 Tax=Adineta steineri TaxID=433720 RepID=A0A818JUV0_9BILA|nr:unnamed protein product [Adineta steineri]